MTAGWAPAQANDTVATLQGAADQRYDRVLPGCNYYKISYDLNLPDGVSSWSVFIGDGPSGESLSDYGLYGDNPSGEISLLFCNSDFDKVGRAPLTLEGDYRTADGGVGVIDGHGELRLNPARTRTRLTFAPTQAPQLGQAIRVATRVVVAGRYGFQSAKYIKVHVEFRKAGSWVRLRGRSLLTGANGRDSARYRWNVPGQQTLRLVTPAQDGFRQSVSKPITIRTRH
jgi:hypothetical protein